MIFLPPSYNITSHPKLQSFWPFSGEFVKELLTPFPLFSWGMGACHAMQKKCNYWYKKYPSAHVLRRVLNVVKNFLEIFQKSINDGVFTRRKRSLSQVFLWYAGYFLRILIEEKIAIFLYINAFSWIDWRWYQTQTGAVLVLFK